MSFFLYPFGSGTLIELQRRFPSSFCRGDGTYFDQEVEMWEFFLLPLFCYGFMEKKSKNIWAIGMGGFFLPL